MIKRLCEDIILANGFKGTYMCVGINCVLNKCPFNDICTQKTNKQYAEVAKQWLEKQENDKILEFEEGALEELLDFEMPELDNTGYMKEEKKMTLKEKILAKINYKMVAEFIYDELEDDIAEKVAYNIDEESIARDFISGYKEELLEVAVDVVEESLMEDVDYGDVQDSFKEYVQEQVDNM